MDKSEPRKRVIVSIAARVSSESQREHLPYYEAVLVKHCEVKDYQEFDRLFVVAPVWSRDWTEPVHELSERTKEYGGSKIIFPDTFRVQKHKGWSTANPNQVLTNEELAQLQELCCGLEIEFLCQGTYAQEHSFETKITGCAGGRVTNRVTAKLLAKGMRAKGYSLAQIVEELDRKGFKVSRNTVAKWLRKW